MKPDWDKLGESFDESSKSLIGDVDCTSETGKPLCEKYGVEGFLTMSQNKDMETKLTVHRIITSPIAFFGVVQSLDVSDIKK